MPSPRSTRAPQGLSCHAHDDGFAATTTAMQTDHSPDTSAEPIAPPRDGVSGAEPVTTLTVCNNARSEAKREPLCGGEGLAVACRVPRARFPADAVPSASGRLAQTARSCMRVTATAGRVAGFTAITRSRAAARRPLLLASGRRWRVSWDRVARQARGPSRYLLSASEVAATPRLSHVTRSRDAAARCGMRPRSRCQPRHRWRTEGVTTTAVIEGARSDTNAGLGTVDYLSRAQIAKLTTRRVIDAQAADATQPELRSGRTAGGTPPPAPRSRTCLPIA
jgi:hypothetical protein